MTLYEVHNALARSLGDPFKETTASTIYDGVRYSSIARQGYLYRAACSVINEVVTQLASVPREVAGEVISRLLPSMLSRVTTTTLLGTNDSYRFDLHDTAVNPLPKKRVAFVLSVYLEYIDNIISVPLVSPLRGRKIVSSNSRLQSQKNDCIAWIDYSSNAPFDWFTIIFFPSVHFDQSNYWGNVEFLRYPLNQDLLDPTAEFDFEASFIDTIIKKATLYGMVDDGDLSAKELLPYIAGK